jgi:hypothetical protein
MATIIIKNSTGSGVIPSSLVQGELAINTKDGKLYYGSGSGNIVKEFTGSGGSSFPYTGSAIITGSLTVTGSIRVTAGITGSLQGTATNATTANNADQVYIAENTTPGTYSIPVYPNNGYGSNNQLSSTNITYNQATNALSVNNITASNGLFGTASWATNTLTASLALRASGSLTGSLLGTASYVSGSIFTNTNPALSASYALTASYALNAGSGGGGGGTNLGLVYAVSIGYFMP